VTPSDPKINLADFDVALLFCIHDRVVNTPFRRLKIDNLALTDSARRYTADADYFQRAVTARFSYHGANF
jgi:hypothetical protein